MNRAIKHICLLGYVMLLNVPNVLAFQQSETQDIFFYFEIRDTISSEPIPVNPKIPEGLNYRIQIACFRNPAVPSEYFKGITPIYGISNDKSDVKVYYAGMFRRLADAQNALAEVKNKGFSDSFIDYFTGNTAIFTGKAAALEQEWGTQPFEKIVINNPVLDEPQLSETEIEVETRAGAGTDSGSVKETVRFLFFEFSVSQPILLIRILIILITIAIVCQIILLIWILATRNKMHIVQGKTDKLMGQYQTLLVDYLFSENNEYQFYQIKQIATSEFNKEILINQMIDLSVNLSGEAKEKLRDLYLKLELDRDSIAKAYSRKWHIQIKGFRELAFMNIKEANWKIRDALKSKNDILRMESQLALIRLNEDDPFSFLDDLQRPFTLWEQLNAHEQIIFHNLPIPDFSRWINSPNNTVVIFSLRMIQVFKQIHASKAVIASLEHPDSEVRQTAIKVCGEIQLREALPHLKHLYKNEDYSNSLAIVQTMRKMPDESVLGFLKLVIDKEEDVQLQIEAALAIAKMGETGISALVKLVKSEYKNYQIIIRHVLDKRIS